MNNNLKTLILMIVSSVLFVAAQNAIRGEKSPWIFLAQVAVCVLTISSCWYFFGRSEKLANARSRLVHSFFNSLRTYPQRHVVAAILFSLFFINIPPIDVLPQSVQTLSGTIYWMGILGLLLWSSIKILIPLVSGYGLHFVSKSIFGLLDRTALLVLAVLGIRAAHEPIDQIVQAIRNDPESGLLGIVAIYIVWKLLSLNSLSDSPVSYGGVRAAGMMPAKKWEPQELDKEDIYRTAVHEAGHLIPFGLLTNIPESLSVEVLRKLSATDLYRGWVKHEFSTKQALENQASWQMLMCLTGIEAELIVLGDRGDGAVEDHQNWITVATQFLKCGFGEVFYHAPASEAEREHNRAVLNTLKAKYIEDARDLLSTNRALLEELANVLTDRKKLSREELIPFLSRVQWSAAPAYSKADIS